MTVGRLRATAAHPRFPARSARTRRFTLGRPRDVQVAPDDARVLFLRSAGPEDPVQRLWAFDLEAGEERLLADPADLLTEADEDLPAEERARRERLREQGAGIVGYATDRDVTVAVFGLGGRVFRTAVATGETTELEVERPAFDPRPDPTGRRVAYVAAGDLHLLDEQGRGRELAGEHDPEVSWGSAEFVAAEEMGRTRGYWWSPDGGRLAAARVDRSPVCHWRLGDPAEPAAAPRELAYPAAGTENAAVTLAVLDVGAARPVEVDWDRGALPYLARVDWTAAGGLTLLVQARDQRRAQVLRVEPDSGLTTVVRELADEHWVDLVAGTPAWLDRGRLVTVEDDHDDGTPHGTRRVHVDGRPATPPGLQVEHVVDAAGDTVWFVAGDDPLVSRLHRLDTATGELATLTPGRGVHTGAVGGEVVVSTSSSLDRDGAATLVRRGDQPVAALTSFAAEPELSPRPRLLRLTERELNAALLLPSSDTGTGPLPVLLDPYGGPHVRRVVEARPMLLTSQWFADQGFAVLVVDGRGTPGRGPAWERRVDGDLATPVLEDQVGALHAAAAAEPRLDLDRVAVRGWSFGGFLAALAVLRRPDVFHAGVCGAPVTDWRLYDTHYTERYLGHPDREADAYRRSSLIDDAGLVGAAEPPDDGAPRPLLLIHGLADDNVVAAHSLRLSSALLAAGRPHEFLPLSGVTHMTPQEVVAENLLWFQLGFLRRALDRGG